MNDLSKKLSTLDETELSDLYKTVFSTVEGQLVLEDLKNRCSVKTTTYSDSPYRICLNEGMRTVVLTIETRINYKPDMEEKEDGQES